MPDRTLSFGTCFRTGVSFFLLTFAASAQYVVYSGREYLRTGRSWAQIREVNLNTNQKRQLTNSARNHWRPWCTPDGGSILFTSGSPNGTDALYRFDRITKQESVSVTLWYPLFRVTGSIDSSRVVVEEYDQTIEVIDIVENRAVRRMAGVNPAISPDHRLLAWQTPVDSIAQPEQRSHILLSAVDGSGLVDLGQGSTPVFRSADHSLLFLRSSDESLKIVWYDLQSKSQNIIETQGVDNPFGNPNGLTVSPGGTIVLSICCGRYGSAIYSRLMPNQTWNTFDSNLEKWGDWSSDGLLVYATDGRDLRELSRGKSVWVGDIKVFDSRTGQTRLIVQGVSMNQQPRWSPR